MGISSTLLILAVILLVGMYLYTPLTNKSKTRTEESKEISALKAERDRVIDSLQELDFDHHLGKIPAEDYPLQRTELLQKGAEILKKLDQFEAITPSSLPSSERGKGRGEKQESVTQLDDETVESMIAARRKEHKARSAGFCPKCGKPVLVSDKFCPSCGKSLA